MKTDPALLSATELLSLYRSRSLSPVEATQSCLDRIAALDTDFNAFTLVDGDAALEAARASEERWIKGEPQGLVDGVPATIKDLILTKGWPTLRGSKAVSPINPGRKMPRPRRGCGNTEPCCWARPRHPNWATRASPTARSPASPAIPGTPR